MCGAILGCGGGASPGKDGAVDARDAQAQADRAHDGRGDDQAFVGDLPADAPSNADLTSSDRPVDQAIRGGDAPIEAAPVDSGASCKTQTIILGRGGTTSSCSFKVPSSISKDQVNLTFSAGGLCEQGSNNCTPRGGWFWFGDEVALCDATCLSWENSRANLILEVGCASESCFVACGQAGGRCGDGINSCCAGWRCTSGTCAACERGGQSCGTNGDCCSGACKGGACVDPLGGTCVSQAGCSQGECRDGRCQCAVDQILCNSGCVSYTDPNNCRGCGNVCPTGTGRVCTADGCVCDPQSALPDECSGTCVNKSTDRTNCGSCSLTCPRLDQVCTNSVCGCPPGLTDCNGSCVDLRTSQNHCGMCNRGCPAGVEVCSASACACAPGYTRCSGTCVNLLTSKLNCSACGVPCPGNKTCNNGSCG
jgi:hypothetical protein